MVFIKQGRYPVESAQLRLLRDRMRVVQIEPLGFGGSQRPAVHPGSTGRCSTLSTGRGSAGSRSGDIRKERPWPPLWPSPPTG